MDYSKIITTPFVEEPLALTWSTNNIWNNLLGHECCYGNKNFRSDSMRVADTLRLLLLLSPPMQTTNGASVKKKILLGVGCQVIGVFCRCLVLQYLDMTRLCE